LFELFWNPGIIGFDYEFSHLRPLVHWHLARMLHGMVKTDDLHVVLEALCFMSPSCAQKCFCTKMLTVFKILTMLSHSMSFFLQPKRLFVGFFKPFRQEYHLTTARA